MWFAPPPSVAPCNAEQAFTQRPVVLHSLPDMIETGGMYITAASYKHISSCGRPGHQGQCSLQHADGRKALLGSCAPVRTMICHLQKAWEGSIWPERECRRAHQAWGVCCEEQGPSHRRLRATARRGARPPAASGR